jgi:hypothetical protein
MARATSVFRHTPYASHSPRPIDGSGDTQEDLADLIEDTIRMIENTRSFLTRLDHSQSASRETMARSCQRLEEALTSLKRRQRGLTGCEY